MRQYVLAAGLGHLSAQCMGRAGEQGRPPPGKEWSLQDFCPSPATGW
jgi:hypothetical protein